MEEYDYFKVCHWIIVIFYDHEMCAHFCFLNGFDEIEMRVCVRFAHHFDKCVAIDVICLTNDIVQFVIPYCFSPPDFI